MVEVGGYTWVRDRGRRERRVKRKGGAWQGVRKDGEREGRESRERRE